MRTNPDPAHSATFTKSDDGNEQDVSETLTLAHTPLAYSPAVHTPQAHWLISPMMQPPALNLYSRQLNALDAEVGTMLKHLPIGTRVGVQIGRYYYSRDGRIGVRAVSKGIGLRLGLFLKQLLMDSDSGRAFARIVLVLAGVVGGGVR